MSRASEKVARELARAAAKHSKQAARARLKDVRKQLAGARVERKERMGAVKQLCRDARAKLRVRIAQQRAELAAAVRAERQAQRGMCSASREAAREQTLTKVRTLATHVTNAKHALRLLQRAPRATTKHARGLVTAAESRAESDHAVRVNLPRELVPVFDRVKREIHGSPRRSRTEAFLEWAEENPARVYEIQHAGHDKWLREMEREARKLERGELAVERSPKRVTDEWGGETSPAPRRGGIDWTARPPPESRREELDRMRREHDNRYRAEGT